MPFFRGLRREFTPPASGGFPLHILRFSFQNSKMMWKTLSGLSLLSLAVTSVSAKPSRFDRGAIDRTRENSDVIPGRFIVELHSDNSNSRLAPGSVSCICGQMPVLLIELTGTRVR